MNVVANLPTLTTHPLCSVSVLGVTLASSQLLHDSDGRPNVELSLGLLVLQPSMVPNKSFGHS